VLCSGLRIKTRLWSAIFGCVVCLCVCHCGSVVTIRYTYTVVHVHTVTTANCSHTSLLSFTLRQLSAVKSQVASVDHLKEIERLRGLLSAAEANARTLTAQLNSKEFGE
jgi:hypothetical protein